MPPAQRRDRGPPPHAQRAREGFDPSEFVAVDLWLCRRHGNTISARLPEGTTMHHRLQQSAARASDR